MAKKIFSSQEFRTIWYEKTDLLIGFSIVDLLMKHVLVISICYGKVDFFEFEILKVGVHLAYTVVTVVTWSIFFFLPAGRATQNLSDDRGFLRLGVIWRHNDVTKNPKISEQNIVRSRSAWIIASPMSHTCMSHISFESQYFELLQSEKKNLMVDHLVALESQSKKYMKSLYSATTRSYFDFFFDQYTNYVIRLSIMT